VRLEYSVSSSNHSRDTTGPVRGGASYSLDHELGGHLSIGPAGGRGMPDEGVLRPTQVLRMVDPIEHCEGRGDRTADSAAAVSVVRRGVSSS
jgi:hypothetical protein